MQKGLLTGKFSVERMKNLPQDDHRRNDPMFAEPQLGANLQLIRGLEGLAREHRMTVTELALAWVLRRPDVTSAIVGARRPDQIETPPTRQPRRSPRNSSRQWKSYLQNAI
jgi:aryl-alcohol dehydrogenase-like predicted oxidoreductase